MKYFIAATALVSFIPSIWSLTINTPTGVTQCQPVLLSWSDGTGPYYLSIIPGGQAAAEPIKTFPTQNGNSLTYLVDIAAGTPVTFALKDNTGAMAYTDIVKIQKSSDSSCVNGSNNPPPSPQQVNYASVAAAADSVSSSASAASSGVASVPAGSSASRVTFSAAGAATNRPAGAATQAVQTNNQAASVSSARPTGTTPASAGTTSTGANTSGAQSRSAIGTSLVFAGALGLLGAAFL